MEAEAIQRLFAVGQQTLELLHPRRCILPTRALRFLRKLVANHPLVENPALSSMQSHICKSLSRPWSFRAALCLASDFALPTEMHTWLRCMGTNTSPCQGAAPASKLGKPLREHSTLN